VSSGLRSSVVAGITSGCASAVISYLLDNYDVIRVDKTEIVLIALLFGTVGGFVLLYRSYASCRTSLTNTGSEYRSLRKTLNDLQSSRVVEFRVVEKVTRELSLEDGQEDITVFRTYIAKFERIRVEFKSSVPADFFIHDHGFPGFFRASEASENVSIYPYPMLNAKDWYKVIDCENSYMFATARARKDSGNVTVTIAVSELMPVESK